ncbi:hypothetical protein IKG60_01460 [Candidatus Saccharibacteria bacterium]|nr:hypothetical protein [Candidatus Saccharibacteria bacterium]
MINILVIAISVLTILSAIALVCGSSKKERGRSMWFFAAAVGEVMWGVGIAVALSLPPTEAGYAAMPWVLKCLYVGALIMDSTMLGYVAWKYKTGKIATSIFLIIAAVLSVIFLYDPTVLYTGFTLSYNGNTVDYLMPVDGGWFFAVYIAFFCTVVPAFCLALIYQIKHAKSKNIKRGYLFFLIGLAVAGFMSLIFDLILAPSRYDLIWIGPLLIGLVMLGFYYAVLRYRLITLSTGWLKAMSTVVLVSMVVIVYLLIFHLIFSALFRVSSPSFQVILLNFIMVAIVLLLAPAIAEIWAMIKSLIMTKQIDMAYIVKKLSRVDWRRANYKEMAGFLAEHMHFEYVGFLINGKYYAGDDYKIPVDKLVEVPKLKRPAKGIWQNVSGLDKNLIKEYGVHRVAMLLDTNGEMVGQVILGRPVSKANLDKQDQAETEMLLSLIGTMMENGSRRS